MKILLKQSVSGIGEKGDVVEVNTGHARNFIIPKGLGIQASKKDAEKAETLKEERNRTQKEKEDKLHESLKKVNGSKIVITANGGENGQLYAGLNKGHILPAINEQLGERFGDEHLILPEHIKTSGEHELMLSVDGKKAKVLLQVEVGSK